MAKKNWYKKNVFCVVTGDRVLGVVTKKDTDEAANAWKPIYSDVRVVPIGDILEKSESALEQMCQLFARMGRPCAVYERHDGNICIDVTWGDWKHDHENVDFVMKDAFGCELAQEIVAEEDGSDVYSSIHVYAAQ